MTNSFLQFERRARLIMGGIAVFLVIALVLFKTGLVSNVPNYNTSAWYSVSDNGGFIITREFADESGCRNSDTTKSLICLSGKQLADTLPGRTALN